LICGIVQLVERRVDWVEPVVGLFDLWDGVDFEAVVLFFLALVDSLLQAFRDAMVSMFRGTTRLVWDVVGGC